MSNKLCGVTLIKDGVKYDYTFKECILSLLECCDYVICAFVESSDNTLEILESIDSPFLKILKLTNEDWNFLNNEQRLAYITNVGIQEADRLGFSYVLNVQADEVVLPESYPIIRKALYDNSDGYMIRRINLWGTPNTALNVPQNRLPCSNYVIRLAKVNYRSVGDAESIAVPSCNTEYADKIKIIHYGFVRDKKIMKERSINMQDNVFNMGKDNHDKKLDMADEFIPELWFSENDLIPIDFEHPPVMKEWLYKNERKIRYNENLSTFKTK